jgi:predicted permease
MSEHFSDKHGRRPFTPEPQAEVDAELAFHLEQRIADYIARGMDPAAARAAALQRLGDLGGVRQECTDLLTADRRAERRRDWFGDLRQDLHFGVRSALRAPVFSLLAIITLALGIGANAAIFGVVKSVLLDALPFAEPNRIVRVYGRLLDGTQDRGPVSAGTVADIAARQHSFTHIAAFGGLPLDLAFLGDDEPKVIKAVQVEPALFPTLGVRAAVGRTISDADTAVGAERVVMLTHAAWQRLYGGDPAAIGRTPRIDGVPRTIVGVLPPDFVSPVGDVSVYLPLALRNSLADPVRARRRYWLGFIGRLKPGVTVEAAHRELSTLATDLGREHPQDNAGMGIETVRVRDALVGSSRTPLLVLMASAGLVLVIACANLAGALLSRTISRRKEFAIRVALGAGRGRLMRQLLTESVVLAIAGGAAGLLLASLGLGILRTLALPALPPYAKLALDGGALAFTSLLALLTGIAFGVAPALAVTRSDPHDALRDESRGMSEGRHSRRLRGLLVAGQIALCISLLAGAGLLARSLWAMASSPLGFDPDDVLAVAVQLPPRDYATTEARVQFLERFEERLRTLPGVTSVASTGELPTRVMNRNGILLEGTTPSSSDAMPFIHYVGVSSGYFETARIPLLSGRTFGPEDRVDRPPTLVISNGMARRFWPAGNALGSRLRMGPDPSAPLMEIVGIVGDVRNDPARSEPEPMMYASNRWDPWGGSTFLVRTAGDPLALVPAVRRELAAIDPRVPIDDAMTLRGLLAEGLSGRKLPVVLMTAFGALALLLASVGVYAMFAAMATAREREFGVRLALGASPRGIAALVVRQGAMWMAVGLVGGLLGVVIVTRVLAGLLYGVTRYDPLTLGAAVMMLLVCGTVALLVPIRRAARVDPTSVLR